MTNGGITQTAQNVEAARQRAGQTLQQQGGLIGYLRNLAAARRAGTRTGTTPTQPSKVVGGGYFVDKAMLTRDEMRAGGVQIGPLGVFDMLRPGIFIAKPQTNTTVPQAGMYSPPPYTPPAYTPPPTQQPGAGVGAVTAAGGVPTTTPNGRVAQSLEVQKFEGAVETIPMTMVKGLGNVEIVG